ncbi:MAG: hypothetical protein CVV24_02765 [Ignavibacteriae bacterium HGW-Ignavibacteriae-3]|nr:MAG: hypothetical protein CVV24_02765 [Ignavibacteriae bacterium HGW-Ignavibacteriae-3]
MKKNLLSIILAFSFCTASYGSNEILLKSAPASVKVFLKGAQLNYSVRTQLERGLNDLVFTGLASNIDRNSINVSAKGEAVIISVAQRFNFLRIPEKTPQIKNLEDSLDSQNRNLAFNQNETDVFKSEIDLILANKNIGNEKIGVSVSELQKMGEYYRKRLTEIKSKIFELSLSAKKIKKNIDRIQNQLEELNNQLNKPVNEIVVTVSSNTGTILDLELTYLIFDAGWRPAYDIRIDNVNSYASLNYNADVWQNSGFDWNDAQIILSTRNPGSNNNKPELNPWYLDFERPVLLREMKSGTEKFASSGVMQTVLDAAAPAETMANFIDVLETQLSIEFTSSIKYSIPSDSKPHTMALQVYTVPSIYEYYAAPKLDNNAFLVAKLTDWNKYNLLPGQANIYFGNSYVGRSGINPATTKDTLTISLGRDQNISVSREVVKDFSEDKFLSSNVERIFAFEIIVKNNKKQLTKIMVEDQIPVSRHEDIAVKLIESSGAIYDAETGTVKWIVDADGGKSVVKKLIYSVKYPKDKRIMGL